jgi:hypothetical protein
MLGAAPAPAQAERCGEEALAAFRARRKKERETEPEESRTDVNAYEAHLYRVFWNNMFAGECGSYEDTSKPFDRFTPVLIASSILISTSNSLQKF